MLDATSRLLAEKIKRRREELRLTLQDLADRTGLNKSTLQRYESGAIHSIPLVRLKALARALEVSDEWMIEASAMERALPVRHMSRIPIIGVVRAGYSGLAYEEHDGDDTADVANPDEYFFLRVTGDSMSPGINEGELALVHKQSDVQSGEIGIAIVDGDQGTIKRIIKKRDKLILQPFNPAYPPLVFTGEEMEQVRIVGRVVETKRKW